MVGFGGVGGFFADDSPPVTVAVGGRISLLFLSDEVDGSPPVFIVETSQGVGFSDVIEAQ